MIFAERAGNFRERRRDLIRLGGDEENRCAFGHIEVGGDSSCAGFGGEMLACGREGIGGEELVCFNQLGVDETLGERGGHLACAEKTDL